MLIILWSKSLEIKKLLKDFGKYTTTNDQRSQMLNITLGILFISEEKLWGFQLLFKIMIHFLIIKKKSSL